MDRLAQLAQIRPSQDRLVRLDLQVQLRPLRARLARLALKVILAIKVLLAQPAQASLGRRDLRDLFRPFPALQDQALLVRQAQLERSDPPEVLVLHQTLLVQQVLLAQPDLLVLVVQPVQPELLVRHRQRLGQQDQA